MKLGQKVWWVHGVIGSKPKQGVVVALKADGVEVQIAGEPGTICANKEWFHLTEQSAQAAMNLRK